jgi:dienelactone hydrolase
MAEMLESRLVAAGKRGQITHLRYPHAGHSFMPWRPNLRSELLGRSIDSLRLAGFGGMFDFGGRPRANRDAHDDAWDHVTKFLVEELA